MAIRFTCPYCGVQMNVDPAYAGQTGPCSKCGEKISIPEAKLSDLPPVGGYGAPSSGGASTGCVVAGLAFTAILMTLVVCGGGLLFAVARPARMAAQSAQSNNNMKMIGLALMNYHEVNNSFPPAYVTDAQGNKLYSWRVLILPYIEQAALYDAYDKSKAWDSPENASLSQQMIPIFRAPSQPGATCSYFAITGKGTAFEGGSSIRFSDVTDGTSNTIFIVEALELGRSWAEPYDIDLDSNAIITGFAPGQLPGPGSPIIHALKMDGSIVNLYPNEAQFRSLASIRGGELTDSTSVTVVNGETLVPIAVPPTAPVPPGAPIVPERPPVVDGNDSAQEEETVEGTTEGKNTEANKG